MEELERFSRLIEDMYDAAMGETSFWPLGQRIAAALNSESCSITALGGTNGPVEALTLTDNCLASLPGYIEHYHKIDPWAALGQSQPQNMMVASQDHIHDDEFRRTEFYQDHCRPGATAYVLGAVVDLSSLNAARGVIGIHRAENEEQFSAADKRHGTLILPHLRRAMQLRERLAQLNIQKRSMLDATSALGVGVIVVEQNARIISINPTGEALLHYKSCLQIQNGRLISAQPFEDDQLGRTIRSAANASIGRSTKAGGLVRIQRRGKKPLALSVYPFTAPRSTDGSIVPAALILIADPEAAQPPTRDALALMYGLTGAEARLFEALLTGERLQDFADSHRISIQTVRTQLAHIFHKTGHSRQADLVRDALSNPILRISRS
jgi:DNA-binding CsgD family transcriptional regulator/PAS domain-containing protein